MAVTVRIAAAVGCVVGAILASGPAFFAGHVFGKQEGRAAAKLEQAQASANAERERKMNDAKLRALSDFDLCVNTLRSRKLHTDACEQLRGNGPQRSITERNSGVN